MSLQQLISQLSAQSLMYLAAALGLSFFFMLISMWKKGDAEVEGHWGGFGGASGGWRASHTLLWFALTAILAICLATVSTYGLYFLSRVPVTAAPPPTAPPAPAPPPTLLNPDLIRIQSALATLRSSPWNAAKPPKSAEQLTGLANQLEQLAGASTK